MLPRILGIDISDINTTLVYYNEDISIKYPTIISKDKNSEAWFVGEEAYKMALEGTGLMSLNLLTMTIKDTFMSVGANKYYGKDLLKLYISLLIEKSLNSTKPIYPEKIVISIPKITPALLEKLTDIFMNLGYLRDNILIISRAESFIYYIMSKPNEYFNNQVALFDLSDKNFVYYELKAIRHMRDFIVYADSKRMEESINIDLLKTASGAKLADRILSDTAKGLMQKKLFSSIVLTGKGFENIDWAKDFTKHIAGRRKLIYDPDVFAIGASIKGLELSEENFKFKFTCICEGHIDTNVSLNILKDAKIYPFPLAYAGDIWYKKKNELDLLLDSSGELEFVFNSNDMRRKKVFKMKVDFLKDRPLKARKITLKTSFTSNRTFFVELSDAGFGEFFKKTEARLTKEFDLWE